MQKIQRERRMSMKYVCSICGYVYDELKEGKSFDSLQDSWTCPWCGAGKSAFRAQGEPRTAPDAGKESGEKTQRSEPVLHDGDMKKLSAGEISAICSNLARGCEKQYKNNEAELYRRIAGYFADAVPDEPEADMELLSGLIKNDLQQGYPDLRTAAEEAGDRGTLRICVWGEKVTSILNSLLMRYEREGENFLKNTQIWVCTICGFVYVGDQPPELCPVCKVPDWKFEKVERRVSA